MSLFNDIQGSSEPILDFSSRFDGMVLDMSRLKIFLPPIFLVMLFCCALHSRYSGIRDQLWSQYKTLETGTIDSVVEDARDHDEFKLVGSDKKGGPTFKAATANVDSSGKEWALPFEWLSSYTKKGLRLVEIGPLLALVSVLFAIMWRNPGTGTYLPTALSSKN